ncbi:unnamed protein product, partial [Ectocarpus fasciculatus]
ATRDPRAVTRQLRTVLDANPHLEPAYRRAKQVVRIFRKASFYEITQRCNLRCEGCYYFEGSQELGVTEEDDLNVWEDFFAKEGERGVSMAYFFGAEPALEQGRLRAAAEHLDYGYFGTNGTMRVAEDLPFKLSVSLWAGDDETDKTLRGATVYKKALKNFSGDPRANVVFTLTPWNLDTVPTVVQMCEDYGIGITFNMYSPTETFLDKLKRNLPNDDQFFRVSSQENSPCFTPDQLLQTRDTVEAVMTDFPDTVIYSRAFNRWVTQPQSLHEIDPETGIAPHCGSRIQGNMRYFTTDLAEKTPKCCTPDTNCGDCRMYSGAWSTKLMPTTDDFSSPQKLEEWIEMMDALSRIFLYPA